MKMFHWALLLSAILFSANVQAQDQAPGNWFLLDLQSDGYAGLSANKAHEQLLKGKKAQTVIVAVIDSGVDIEHEDLQDIIWVNEDEIPGNGIDDDHNGYVDDIHGWNFIGGANGENVNHDSYEISRLYAKYKAMFDGKDTDKLSKKERAMYDEYLEIKKTIEEKREELQGNLDLYTGIKEAINKVKELVGKDDFTAEDLDSLQVDDPSLGQAMMILSNVLSQGGTVAELEEQLDGAIEYFSNSLNYGYNPDFDPRSIVGDDYSNVKERYYGNNDVEGPDASHGTHVSGIIAAIRNNNIGIDGVADHVRIMSVRTVPDGDERDKDVANAIIYAVDNGAKVINMSFGKGYAWNKGAVDKAVKYARKHDVLLVHAAGNSAQNNDETDNFPNDTYAKRGFLGLGPKQADNWLEIGALSWKKGEDAPATFSNYGKKSVDVFSPGVDIYSCVPQSDYASFSGTSMASPATAGVAALIRAYYPEFSAQEVRQIILDSAIPQNYKVKKPGSKELVDFSELCATGAIVNAYRALQLAEERSKK